MQRVIVYPSYVNASLSVSQGRRVPKVAGAEDPTAPEIYDCIVSALKLPAEIEKKAYPKEFFLLGRVRVTLKKDDGTPINPDIPNRTALLKRIAALLPRHPNRLNKPRPLSGAAEAKALLAKQFGAGTPGAGPAKGQPAAKKAGGKKKR